MLTLTHRVVAMRAAAIRAVAHRTGVRTVRAATGGAFVVVHSLVGAMLAVHVAIMQVVNMVGVQHRFVSTPWAMGVRVVLGLSVLDRGHGGLPLRMDHSMLICAGLHVKPSDGRPTVRLRPMPTRTTESRLPSPDSPWPSDGRRHSGLIQRVITASCTTSLRITF